MPPFVYSFIDKYGNTVTKTEYGVRRLGYGVRRLGIKGETYTTRYGALVQIIDEFTVKIIGLSGKYYYKDLLSVITKHSNGYYYLLYSSKNTCMRRDSRLFNYSENMNNSFHLPKENKSDFIYTVATFGIIMLFSDVKQDKEISEDELKKRLPTHKELYWYLK